MTTIKNTFGKRFLIGLTVLGLSAGLGSTALAQEAHDPARQQAHAAKMHEKMAQHHAMLHDKLKLTTAQEPAWATFGASMKPGQRPARMDRAALAKMSAPQRMEAPDRHVQGTHQPPGNPPRRAENLLCDAHARAAKGIR